MTTLQSLSKKCTQQTGKGAITALQLVRGYNDSFAVNTEGGITAFSLTDETLTSLTLGTADQALEYLYLSGCTALESLVFEPNCTFPYLTHLYLDGCNLTDIKIPAGCTALQQVYVQKQVNKLKSLVFEGDCPALVLLDASDNDLAAFNMPVIFENLKYLYLKGNENIGYLPKEIYIEKTNSADSVKAYLRAALQSGSIINREAKCIFFGNGRAGKTTLSHQLRKGVFDKNIELTHGILIEEWAIPENEFPAELREKINRETDILNKTSTQSVSPPDSIQLNVWDFGGQEYFHATHRLFLNNNVLYLVVWEEATNAQNEEKGDYPESYWQSNIRHYAPKNITFNIHNKEKGNALINHQARRYKIAARDEADADSIEAYQWDVKTLKTGIFKQLPHLEYLGAPIPKLYDAIRQELRRIKTDKPYLLFEDYKNLCQRMDETPDKIMQNDTNIETLTTFLHDTGSLICYRYATKKKNNVLDNYVFIDPKWVTTTIYAILDDTIRQKNGEFTTTHVAEVLETHQNVIRDAAIWLGLMTEFELIFKKRHTDTVFIAPQYLPLKCSDLSVKAWDNLVDKLPHQLVLWYPDFLPKSVISRFICLNGNLAKDYYWKYGIVINTDGEEALVHCDYNAKHITIQTHTPLSALAVKLFDILRGIDATDSLEIALQYNNETANKIGFVNFKELKERADKNEVNWNGQYFEVAPFSALLGNAHGFASHEKEKADTIETNRMIGRIDKQNKPKPTIDEIKPIIQPLNSEIMSIETVKNQVRDYIAKARTDHAISVIESWAKGNKALAAQNAIAMIQADYRKLRSEEMLGIAENVGQRTATINYRILNFEWQLDAPSPVGETPKGVTITQPPSSGSITMKILFIASNPSDQTRLQTDKEHRLIKAEMERGSHRDKFEFLPPQFAVTITELLRAMNDKPQIVHFSGHGVEEGIVITTEANASQVLPIPAIKRLFRPLQNVAKVVLLNACYSAAQAEEISKFDCYVVGYTKPIGDAAAIGFAQGLYNGLGEGKSFEDAYNDAMIVLLTIAEQYAETVEVWKNGMKVSL